MYSQGDEEKYILDICPPTGKFLDIGAWDGVTFSNTRALFNQGWSGVLVEPASVPFKKLQALYSGAGNVWLVKAAVCDSPGMVELWETEDAVSTTLASHYDKWKSAAEYTGCRKVRAVTIEELVNDHGPFDFVNIDTEGTSVDVFLRLDLCHMRPTCICVEHDQRIREVMDRATQYGYAIAYQNGENMVLKCGQ